MTLKLLGICAICFLITGTEALAFGGSGEHDNRTREFYKHGVDAIGVHINGKACADDEELIDGKCVEICPQERQCGATCCGEGNVCVDGNKCCFGDGSDDTKCCDATESSGFNSFYQTCCTNTETTYVAELDMSGQYTVCCPKENLKKKVGYKGQSVCCDHDVQEYKDFEVCWAPETICKTNNDCQSNEFCNLENETDYSCYYPTSGLCKQITSRDYIDATVEGLGLVRQSMNFMTWWAADQWCKAQKRSDGTPMELISVEKFQVYQAGTATLITEGSAKFSYACAREKICGHWYYEPYKAMWNLDDWTLTGATDATGERYQDKFSPVVTDLQVKADNHFSGFWTTSDYYPDSDCFTFIVALNGGSLFPYYRADLAHALCN